MFKYSPYKRLSKYYDLCKGDFKEDLPLYLSQSNQKNRILEIGCGTGRILKTFLEIGCSITGIDLSKEMLAIAEKKLSKYIINGELKLFSHDFSKSPLNEKYDYVMITYYTFNYLLNSKKQLKFLKNVYETMKTNALIILDLFYPTKEFTYQNNNQEWEERLFELDGRKVLLKQRSKMANKIEKRVQYFFENDRNEKIITYRRYITKEEIYSLLLEAKFSNILFTDSYDLKGFHEYKCEEKIYCNFIVKAEKK